METKLKKNEGMFHIPEMGTYQGELEVKATLNGDYTFRLNDLANRQPLINLHNGQFNLHHLIAFGNGSILQVSGFMDLGQEPYTMRVDEAILLKSGHEIHVPAIELSSKEMTNWFKSNVSNLTDTKTVVRNSVTASATKPVSTCPASVKADIEKQVKQIKASAEQLKKIEWKKYATIGGMAVGLISSTISAATAAIPIAGPAIAGGLLVAKVTALYSAIGSLNNLEGWAKTEAKLMLTAKENLEKIKKAYPVCFK